MLYCYHPSLQYNHSTHCAGHHIIFYCCYKCERESASRKIKRRASSSSPLSQEDERSRGEDLEKVVSNDLWESHPLLCLVSIQTVTRTYTHTCWIRYPLDNVRPQCGFSVTDVDMAPPRQLREPLWEGVCVSSEHMCSYMCLCICVFPSVLWLRGTYVDFLKCYLSIKCLR